MSSLQFRPLFFASRPRCVFLAMLAVVGILLLTRTYATAYDPGEKPAEELAKDLQKQLSKGEIDRIEVYYSNWGSTGNLSKNDLPTMYDYKVTVQHDRRDFSRLAEVLGRQKFRRLGQEWLFGEYNLACIFYSKGKERLGIFFGKWGLVCSINDAVFETDPALLIAITAYLPHEAYEEMYQSGLALLVLAMHAELRNREQGQDVNVPPRPEPGMRGMMGGVIPETSIK